MTVPEWLKLTLLAPSFQLHSNWPTFLPNFLCSRSFLAFSDFSIIACFEISFFLIWMIEQENMFLVCQYMNSNNAEKDRVFALEWISTTKYNSSTWLIFQVSEVWVPQRKKYPVALAFMFLQKPCNKQPAYLLHLLIGLGHLCKVILGPLGGYAMLGEERHGLENCSLSLTVAMSWQNIYNGVIFWTRWMHFSKGEFINTPIVALLSLTRTSPSGNHPLRWRLLC